MWRRMDDVTIGTGTLKNGSVLSVITINVSIN